MKPAFSTLPSGHRRWSPVARLVLCAALAYGVVSCSDDSDSTVTDTSTTVLTALSKGLAQTPAEQQAAVEQQASEQRRINAITTDLTAMQTECDAGDQTRCADFDKILGQVCDEPDLVSVCADFGGESSTAPSSTAASTGRTAPPEVTGSSTTVTTTAS